jgi:DNA-binding NtrC family response regulator
MKENGHGMILYVSDGAAASKSVLEAIELACHDVVSTNKPNEAMALLFVMHSPAAVVLDLHAPEPSSFDFARKLRAIHPGVPIMLRCCEHAGSLPVWVDAYLSAKDPLDKLISTLKTMLTKHCRLAHLRSA